MSETQARGVPEPPHADLLKQSKSPEPPHTGSVEELKHEVRKLKTWRTVLASGASLIVGTAAILISIWIADVRDAVKTAETVASDAAKTADTLKQTVYEHERKKLIDDVEDALNDLMLFDLLYSDGATRAFLVRKQNEFDSLREESQPQQPIIDGYEKFVKALVLFARTDPPKVDKKCLEDMQKLLLEQQRETTANYWYLLASTEARLGNYRTSSKFAIDEAMDMRGGLPRIARARIRNGSILWKLGLASAKVDVAELSGELEALLSEFPEFWPARVTYAALYSLKGDGKKEKDEEVTNTDRAKMQLVFAVDTGGARIEQVIELLECDRQIYGDNLLKHLRDKCEAEAKDRDWDDVLIDYLKGKEKHRWNVRNTLYELTERELERLRGEVASDDKKDRTP